MLLLFPMLSLFPILFYHHLKVLYPDIYTSCTCTTFIEILFSTNECSIIVFRKNTNTSLFSPLGVKLSFCTYFRYLIELVIILYLFPTKLYRPQTSKHWIISLAESKSMLILFLLNLWCPSRISFQYNHSSYSELCFIKSLWFGSLMIFLYNSCTSVYYLSKNSVIISYLLHSSGIFSCSVHMETYFATNEFQLVQNH